MLTGTSIREAYRTPTPSSEIEMNDKTANEKKATTGIVLGAVTFAVLCASFVAVRPPSSTVARAGHVHAHMTYVGHAPKSANG